MDLQHRATGALTGFKWRDGGFLVSPASNRILASRGWECILLIRACAPSIPRPCNLGTGSMKLIRELQRCLSATVKLQLAEPAVFERTIVPWLRMQISKEGPGSLLPFAPLPLTRLLLMLLL